MFLTNFCIAFLRGILGSVQCGYCELYVFRAFVSYKYMISQLNTVSEKHLKWLTKKFFDGDFDFVVVDPRQAHFDFFRQVFPVLPIFQRAFVQRRDPREGVAQHLRKNSTIYRVRTLSDSLNSIALLCTAANRWRRWIRLASAAVHLFFLCPS